MKTSNTNNFHESQLTKLAQAYDSSFNYGDVPLSDLQGQVYGAKNLQALENELNTPIIPYDEFGNPVVEGLKGIGNMGIDWTYGLGRNLVNAPSRIMDSLRFKRAINDPYYGPGLKAELKRQGWTDDEISDLASPGWNAASAALDAAFAVPVIRGGQAIVGRLKDKVPWNKFFKGSGGIVGKVLGTAGRGMKNWGRQAGQIFTDPFGRKVWNNKVPSQKNTPQGYNTKQLTGSVKNTGRLGKILSKLNGKKGTLGILGALGTLSYLSGSLPASQNRKALEAATQASDTDWGNTLNSDTAHYGIGIGGGSILGNMLTGGSALGTTVGAGLGGLGTWIMKNPEQAKAIWNQFQDTLK